MSALPVVDEQGGRPGGLSGGEGEYLFTFIVILFLAVCPAGKVVALYSRFDVIVSEAHTLVVVCIIFVLLGCFEIEAV